jgi:SAM-dependent methyltransferase
MSHANERQRRTVFDEVAETYDAVRPGYPAAVYDDIRALMGISDGGDILEIGCGTGQATLPLAERGYRICCVELGAELAAIARRNLAAYPRVAVRHGAFEALPLADASFDLVISATAFHWIDPATGYPKLARVLRPGGSVALFWNKHIAGAADGGFFEAVQPVYREYAPVLYGEGNGLPTADELPDESARLAATGLFEAFTVRRYPWVGRYCTAAYLNLLDTYSDHRALPAEQRQRLHEGIAALLDGRYGGQVAIQYLTVLYVAHRR